MERLTIKERQILETFWHNDQSLSVSDVSLLLPEESKHTVTAVITKLLKKGYLKIDTVEIYGKSLARKFVPTLSEASYLLAVLPSKTVLKVVLQYIRHIDDLDYLNKLEHKLRLRTTKNHLAVNKLPLTSKV
ncbi:BlaI/MecI/CopY family transcriptional regulator [Enterococcus sp. LJL90]